MNTQPERGLFRRVVSSGGKVQYIRVAETDPDGWFPTAGLWLVEETRGGKHSHCFVRQEKVAELPDPLTAAALERHKDTLVTVIWECWRKWQAEPMSVNEVADTILEAVREKMGEEPEKETPE